MSFMRPVIRAAMSSTVPRARGPIGAVIASAILVLATVGPMSAATPSTAFKASPWSKAPTRTVTRHHVASARIAGQLAVGSPRVAQHKALPLRGVKIAHPAPSSATRLPKLSGATPVMPRIVSPPDLEVAAQFTGLDTAEGGGFEPPDPWVAVSSSYVVQVVNSEARISNRLGTEISSVPTWALFALPAGQSDSDARVIWDATHGRWVAISISFNGDFSANYFNLAVSDGADPTAGWATYGIFYGDFLPDYPSVASSNDKIVLTDNLFDNTLAFFGADLTTITWASILGGANLAGNECIGDGLIHPRAAQVLSSSADVHLIMELAGDGEQIYFRLTGTGSCDVGIIDGTDLALFAKFSVPPDPRQSAADTIDTALDERPTDAIWQNGHLWWVSTFPITYDAGATYNDGVVLWNATTVASGPASETDAQLISAGDGVDDFMGGIGMTKNGTLVVVYSESTSSTFVSLEANQIPPGSSLGTPVHLDDGDASYIGERWGDYAGVAMDPTGYGSVWATHEVPDTDGTWRTDVVRLVADNDSPGLPGIAVPSIVTPTGLGASVPVRLTWSAATDVSTNVARYEIQQSIDSTGFAGVGSVTGLSTVRQLLIGHSYVFQVRAIDAVGNAGSWRASASFHPYLYQQTSGVVYTGTGWGTSSSSAYSGGSTRYASLAGRYATFTASTARSIAFVTTKASSRGSFKVYVDGVYKATISTYSTTTKYRQVVYQFSWSTPGTHKVKIYVVGTSGHPRVDVDAFIVLR
jgi:hypothetical protein